MDVGDWLRGLGLGQYVDLFRASEIDADVLPDICDADLEKLGVPLGHRKRLLKAIASLGEPAPRPPQPRHAESAERRHLTVMFCDLVGSTGISATLDAEDWRDLVGGYLEAASAAVTHMGGHVAKKLGDGLMALFGYPLARENDAERAIRAALAIQRALAEINVRDAGSGRPDLRARIGVESGAVVVDSAGEVFGDAPNVAAKVQGLAEPGSIWATARVRRQIAGLFVVEERGAHDLRGVNEPIELFRIVRASGAGRQPSHRALTPFIGRDDELAMLLGRWERARRGEGQFARIIGEPGLGKSRLIDEFRARLVETPYSWIGWGASQLLQNTPLHPIADWGRQRFGGADTAAERRLADLEISLSSVGLDPVELVPLLAPLLDVPIPPERVADFAPDELRRRQLAALLAWIVAGARAQPIVLAVEDLHWIDPTTLDLLRALAEQGDGASLLIIATARPEFRAPWAERAHHGSITLGPLDRLQVRRMVGELAAHQLLPRDVVDGVSERTGGVPLFIEEVTRLLLERGAGRGANSIPPTLQQSLTARLDRLGTAREVAMIGAALGRGFSHALLRAVAGLDDAPLREALERLAEADILLVEGVPPEADYRFKHALIQDAAYENLLKSRRRALHRRVAAALRDQFPDLASAQPEALAHHFTQGGETRAAIEWWGRAGEQALRRSAFPEAISHLGKAIEMADDPGIGPSAREPGTALVSAARRANLQTSYAQAVMWSRGFGAEEARSAFARAEALAAAAPDAAKRSASLYGQWASHLVRGEMAATREAAATFLRETEPGGATAAAVAARRCLGMTRWLQGDFALAETDLEQAMRMHDPARDRDGRIAFGQDASIGAQSYLGHLNWHFGRPARARELVRDAMRRAVELEHPPTLTSAIQFELNFEVLRADAEAALPLARRLQQLGRELGLPLYSATAALGAGWAGGRLGGASEGGVELREALADFMRQGNRLFAPLFLGRLAELEAEGQSLETALSRADEALALSRQTGEYWSDALLHRIRGDVLQRADATDPAAAAQAYRAAIEVAARQNARGFGLQAALALAKLHRAAGRDRAARDILTPALEGFSPTPEMPEIALAWALLGTSGGKDAAGAVTIG
jgi:predicted ATPase/class 3 adenylate cyclase